MSSVYTTHRELRKDERHLYNRLKSIQDDYYQFISIIQTIFREYPFVANIRCGMWYAPKWDNTCYFKSTDGHVHHWKFSKNRLNMHIALLAAKCGGCVIVDSTRKGKRFPDSFSRTIPIWCTTLNRAVTSIRLKTNFKFEDELYVSNASVSGVGTTDATIGTGKDTFEDYETTQDWKTLHVPLWVSDTEKNQMESMLDSFVKILLESGANLDILSEILQKPLRPLWVCPSSSIFDNMMPDRTKLPFTSIICVSASTIERGYESSYVQGAGDDEESWANGLSAPKFWENEEHIMYGGPIGIEERVNEIVKGQISHDDVIIFTAFDEGDDVEKHTHRVGKTCMYLCDTTSGVNWRNLWDFFGGFLNCSSKSYIFDGNDWDDRYLHAAVPRTYTHSSYGKRPTGRAALIQALEISVPFVMRHLSSSYPKPQINTVLQLYSEGI